jgi:hypothetical protein
VNDDRRQGLHDPAIEELGERSFRVRPYALTGGRTRSNLDLPLETLVLCNARGRLVIEQVSMEQRQILVMADNPISLAEIAAYLDVVIGATRVLVGDLVAAGFLDARTGGSTEQPDIKLLERVLDGLRSL